MFYRALYYYFKLTMSKITKKQWGKKDGKKQVKKVQKVQKVPKKQIKMVKVTSTINRHSLWSTIKDRKVSMDKWWEIKKAMEKVHLSEITLDAREVNGRYRHVITRLKRGDRGRTHFWKSWRNANGVMIRVALFQDATTGEYRLVWYDPDCSLRTSWTPFPPPPKKKEVVPIEKKVFETKNRFESLDDGKERKVAQKNVNFPFLSRNGNPTPSTYNPKWATDALERIRAIKLTPVVKKAPPMKTVSALKPTVPTFKPTVPTFKPNVASQLKVGLDDNKDDGWQSEDDGYPDKDNDYPDGEDGWGNSGTPRIYNSNDAWYE